MFIIILINPILNECFSFVQVIALQTALHIDPGYEVKFKEGTIEKAGSQSEYGRMLVKFATGTGSFITTEATAVKLINTIKQETRVRQKT
jgi:hypothetical protein